MEAIISGIEYFNCVTLEYKVPKAINLGEIYSKINIHVGSTINMHCVFFLSREQDFGKLIN